MADGGEGTLEVLVEAARKKGEVVERRTVEVPGPLGRPVAAELAYLPAARRAILESARAVGLGLVPEGERDAVRASSRGLGVLARAAIDLGAREVWIALGGSANTDGGAGFARAFGTRFLDAEGRELEEGGGALARLEKIVPGTPYDVRIVALTDVKNPLLGPKGTARVYGPQKGATPEQVTLLEEGLARLAYRANPSLATRPGAGAAGGLGFGLVAFAKAELVPGAPRIAEAAGLDAALEGAKLVITGEGKLDRTTFDGKTARQVLARARVHGVPGAIVCGVADPGIVKYASELGIRHVVSLAELAGGDVARAKTDAARLVEEAGAILARQLLAPDAPGS
jgi:glycerate kinase